ncbi:uncharacterized protein An09g01110 [Aspergillus niger]|uniref:Contig An09c0040, genomic contig n=2 Tax=Aspergillus niger TaxID=5061 RepID=A2QT76_ASPNC|nr:uncharacterized protein An09g01110 [Aspergillus niger]CAK49032.1 unnamed protein product [Aspergillus niger]
MKRYKIHPPLFHSSPFGITKVPPPPYFPGTTPILTTHHGKTVKWYRSTTYNALVLGLCNFLAPGIWTAMNSLGGGGSESPYLVDAANALTFGLMVFSCFFGSVVVRIVGIKWTLILGTVGYAPYAAGLYTHNRFGTDWLVLFGAALCGLSAGIFWMAESAIALSYPEPENQGRFLGLWLSFRVGGQILGGAINLGLNVHRNTAGSVSYAVFGVFIALQALGPAAGLLLTEPGKVMRRDGMKVKLRIAHSACAADRAGDVHGGGDVHVLGSVVQCAGAGAGQFLLGCVGAGVWQSVGGGGWWIWATVVTTQYTNEGRSGIDWVDEGFAKGFVLYLMWVAGYFVVGNLAADEEEVVRISGLLRGMESAVQAVSYGLSSVGIMASVGGTYLNFGLWGISLLPAWLVIRQFGVSLEDRKLVRDYGRD